MNKSTNSNPLISVIIPCYNHEKFVKEAIQSIIDQDYENIEFIIIDDGSKDNSVENIQEMIPACQARFNKFEFRHRPNKGLSATLNEALEWCQGEYLSPLASDDIALPIKISFLYGKIIESDADAVFGDIEIFGKVARTRRYKRHAIQHTFADLIKHRSIPKAPASLIKTLAIKDVGGFDERVKIEDWDLWLALTAKGRKLVSYPKIVANYRRHENNITNDHYLMAIERKKIIDKFRGWPEYELAVRYANLQIARELAETQKFRALKFYAQSGGVSMLHLFVLFKIILPKSIIKFINNF